MNRVGPLAAPEPLALARLVARNAQSILAEVENADLVMAQGYAIVLREQLKELLLSLERRIEPFGEPAQTAPNINPYTDPLAGRVGDMSAMRKELSDEQLREHARYWNWSHDHQKDGYGRWWCSKIISATQRELAERGQDPDSWQREREVP